MMDKQVVFTDEQIKYLKEFAIRYDEEYDEGRKEGFAFFAKLVDEVRPDIDLVTYITDEEWDNWVEK